MPETSTSPGRVAHALRSARFASVLVLLGVALRVWAYVGNPSLWLDEILLSRNILGLTSRALATVSTWRQLSRRNPSA